MKPLSRAPRLQVLHQPSAKSPRSLERAAIFMLIGMFTLGVYGQYSGRGPGNAPVHRTPVKTPVFEYQRLSANSAERTAAAGQSQQERRPDQERPARLQL